MPPAPCRWCSASERPKPPSPIRCWRITGRRNRNLALGQALRGKATSALDISDGLLADCGHIALASKVGIQVERDRLPLSKALVAFLGQSGAEDAALSGGDDYVLAFTLPSVELPRLLADGWPIHVVGRVVAGQGVMLLDADGQDITPQTRGYQHFRETP